VEFPVIGPSTRLFGLVMTDPRAEGHVTRLFNYLFGVNGLDAAYLSFLVKPQQLEFTLTGFKTTGQAELIHLAPAHQEAAGRWLQAAGPVDTLVLRGGTVQGTLEHADPSTWLDIDAVCARALADGRRWFQRELIAPPDWRDVVHETKFRPCKMTHDDFEEHHVRRPA
jgi:hypothetical protein